MNGRGKKFSEIQTKRSILKNLQGPAKNDVKKAGIGEDYGQLFLMGQGKGLAVATGVIGAAASAGILGELTRIYNNAVISGGKPVAMTDCIIMPEADEKAMKKLLMELKAAADTLGMDIISGHTEVNDQVQMPVITVNVFSVCDMGEDQRSSTKITIDTDKDCLVMCGLTGIYGTYELYMEQKQELLTRYSRDYLRTVERLKLAWGIDDMVSIAKSHGAGYLHDISTGGVYAALWELADRISLGIEVSHDSIPILQETVEICEFTGHNPYTIDGTGAFVCVIKKAQAEALISEMHKAGYEAAVIGTLNTGKDRVITHDGEVRYLESPRYL